MDPLTRSQSWLGKLPGTVAVAMVSALTGQWENNTGKTSFAHHKTWRVLDYAVYSSLRAGHALTMYMQASFSKTVHVLDHILRREVSVRGGINEKLSYFS